MHRKVKKRRTPEAFWEVLVIARYSDMVYKCHLNNLAEARRMKYQTVWKKTEEYSQMLSISWRASSKINNDASISYKKRTKENVHCFQKCYPRAQLKKNCKTISRPNSLHQPTQNYSETVTRITFSDKQNSDWNTETPGNTSYGSWINSIIKDCYS